MRDRFLATCDQVLPDADVPALVHLMPANHFKARDGRAFTLDDPDAVIAAFHEGKIDLPVDYEHQADNREALAKGPVKAAGWITGLEFQPDSGLWAHVKWTATAAEMIRRREYRFISLSFYHDENKRVLRLKGAGLVHTPALHLKALAREETTMPTDALPQKDATDKARPSLLSTLVQLFDLPETATEADVIRRVAQLMIGPGKAVAAQAPDPAQFVPATAVEGMLAQRNAELAAAHDARVTKKVDDALSAGAFLPPLREWALALGRSDEAELDRFLAGVGTPYAHLKQELAHLKALPPGTGSLYVVEANGIEAQLGLKPGSLRN